jgi:GDP-4-dehydro-6-deoxy-D-mannose reductase
MRILVTGASGFVGGYLIEALLRQPGVEITGVSRRAALSPQWDAVAGHVRLRACDLCDSTGLEALLREVQPQQIYHLAGYASPGQSFKEPDAAWEGNLTATQRLYDAVERWGGQPRILFVGSGLIYGDSERLIACSTVSACSTSTGSNGSNSVLTEETPLRPNSPYAASKAAADLLSYQVSCAPGLAVIRARPFNHIGPGQSPQYAAANFARQIVAIERGEQPPVLEVGNLQPRRDLSDVRDVVAAYLLLMEKGQPGEAYHIASGQSHPMQHLLDRLLALGRVKVEVRQRADLVRGTDQTTPTVDVSRLRQATGWSPRFSLDQTLTDILAFWRQRAHPVS